MKDFDGFMEMFAENEGNPIKYKGETLIMSDAIDVASEFSVTIEIISCNSEWRQGIVISVNGEMDINVGQGDMGSKFILWEEIWSELNYREVVVNGYSKDKKLIIYNAWDNGSGRLDSFWNGSAMKKEIVNDYEYIYYCNDGHFDDDFDDIIFRVKIIEGLDE